MCEDVPDAVWSPYRQVPHAFLAWNDAKKKKCLIGCEVLLRITPWSVYSAAPNQSPSMFNGVWCRYGREWCPYMLHSVVIRKLSIAQPHRPMCSSFLWVVPGKQSLGILSMGACTAKVSLIRAGNNVYSSTCPNRSLLGAIRSGVCMQFNLSKATIPWCK